jgi:hypothetical protein
LSKSGPIVGSRGRHQLTAKAVLIPPQHFTAIDPAHHLDVRVAFAFALAPFYFSLVNGLARFRRVQRVMLFFLLVFHVPTSCDHPSCDPDGFYAPFVQIGLQMPSIPLVSGRLNTQLACKLYCGIYRINDADSSAGVCTLPSLEVGAVEQDADTRTGCIVISEAHRPISIIYRVGHQCAMKNI